MCFHLYKHQFNWAHITVLPYKATCWMMYCSATNLTETPYTKTEKQAGNTICFTIRFFLIHTNPNKYMMSGTQIQE